MSVKADYERERSSWTQAASRAEEAYKEKLLGVQGECQEQTDEVGKKVLALNTERLELLACLQETQELYRMELTRSKALENAVKELKAQSQEIGIQLSKQLDEKEQLQQQVAALQEKVESLHVVDRQHGKDRSSGACDQSLHISFLGLLSYSLFLLRRWSGGLAGARGDRHDPRARLCPPALAAAADCR